MSPDELARVFESFTQGEHAKEDGSHHFGGLGLGLTISRVLLQLHSGTIRASSAGRDQGSRFVIELPLAVGAGAGGVPEAAAPVAAPKAGTAHTAGLCILLVEDHEGTRTALTRLLTRRHYKVLAAASVAEALMLAGQGGIDLVVSDIGLPDGDGFALMAELRKEHGLRGIALTGYGMERDVQRAHDAGFVTHLVKPVSIASLEEALDAIR